ncbi:MAG: hypothetical protein EBU81_07305, partial [Proteobacteria bacterium]|nr:hypothetical protein [Pseudomonadota bacterium]
MVVKKGVSTVVITGLEATVGGFVTVSGDFGVKFDPGTKAGEEQLWVVSNAAAASLRAGPVVRAGVSQVKVALLVRGDQKLALQATGAAELQLGDGFASATATGLGVSYNNTGANLDTTLTVAVGSVSTSAPLKVAQGVSTVTVTGLQASIAGFARISGDFGLQLRPGATSGLDELYVVSNNAAASLTAGTAVKAGVREATVALVIRGDQKLALQATGAADLSLGDGFASVSVSAVGVAFNNTGEDMDRLLSVAVGQVVVAAPLKVLNGQSGVVLTGLKATIGGFVTIAGDFGVQKTPAIGTAPEELVVVARNASARLTAGDVVRVGVSNATLALVIRGDQKLALQATGAADLSLGNGFAEVSVTTVGVIFNTTGQDVARTAAVRVGAIEVSAPLQVAAGQSAVILSGLKATVGGFVSISGNFGVQKVSASKPEQEELIVVANSAEARVEAGVALRAGVRDARLAMVIRGDQKLAVQATGAADLNLGAGFATASATSIGVAFNNTGADVVNRTLTVSVGATTVSAPLSVRNGQASVVINGLQAQVAGFVTLSGDFGVERVRGSTPATDELLVVSNQASAGLNAGSVLRAGVRNATVALVIRGDGKLALQATGAAELNLGEGFASASVESIGIAFNNTGADVNRMVSVTVGDASVTAPLKVTQGQAALVLNGLQATVGGFVTVAGNFGVQKTSGATAAADELLIVSNTASAALTAGTAVRAGVRNATVALMIRGDQKMALQATGAVDLSLGGGFASASATAVGVAFNNTGA